MRRLALAILALAPAVALAYAPAPASAQEPVITFESPKRHNSLVVFARPKLTLSLARGAGDLRVWLNGDLLTSEFSRRGNRWSARIGREQGLRLGRNTLSVGADDATGKRRTATRVFRAVRQDPRGAYVARPSPRQLVRRAPFPTVIRTREDLSEFRVWVNKQEVTGRFGPPRPAKVDGFVVRRARIPAVRSLRSGRNILKVRAVTEDFRHRTLFRGFRATPAVAS